LEDNEGNYLGLMPPGDYRWLLRLLRLEQDYEDPESWESWLSPVIRVPGAE
jgi:hypothetical protein